MYCTVIGCKPTWVPWKQFYPGLMDVIRLLMCRTYYSMDRIGTSDAEAWKHDLPVADSFIWIVFYQINYGSILDTVLILLGSVAEFLRYFRFEELFLSRYNTVVLWLSVPCAMSVWIITWSNSITWHLIQVFWQDLLFIDVVLKSSHHGTLISHFDLIRYGISLYTDQMRHGLIWS